MFDEIDGNDLIATVLMDLGSYQVPPPWSAVPRRREVSAYDIT